MFHTHIAIQTVKQFVQENGAYPGRNNPVTDDEEKLAKIASQIANTYGSEVVHPQTTKVVEEM